MGLEDDAKAAARILLDARLAAAPPYLLPTKWQRALSPADVRQQAVTKMDWKQAAQIHLLAAEHALEQALPTVTGKPWSSRFVHCMMLHLTNSAKDGEISDRQQVTLQRAAYDLQRMANPSAARGLMNRIEQAGIDESDLDWFVTLGNSRTQFQRAVDSLNSFHKLVSSRPPVVQVPRNDAPAIAVSVPGQSGMGGDWESTHVAAVATTGGDSQLRHADRPWWLALGPAEGGAVPYTGPAWRMPDSAPATPRDGLEPGPAQRLGLL